jgi:hypothetical protein
VRQGRSRRGPQHYAAITAIIALLDRLGTSVDDDTAVLALGIPAKPADLP